jgi:two-component system, sensor histidine kinase
VVDYRLRDERTGVEAISHVRAAFGDDIPALIVSGDTAPERLREVADSGHTMVHKPVQPAVLRSFLSKALRAKRSE